MKGTRATPRKAGCPWCAKPAVEAYEAYQGPLLLCREHRRERAGIIDVMTATDRERQRHDPQ